MPGVLFLVATPIGNLDDISLRAVRTLKEVDLIACEDTRHTRKLLNHFGITTPLVSYHEHNETTRARELAAKLCAGVTIALVSDAGTPLLSDPGFRLVRAAIGHGIPVHPIPGPSAGLTALAASGLDPNAYRFGGFLPAKAAQRRKELSRWVEWGETLIFYEAPHRMLAALADIEEVLGADRPVVVARELTKLHEEFVRGTASEVRRELAGRPSVRGEITLLIGGAPGSPSGAQADPVSEVESLVQQGLPRMEAIKQVARRHGVPKRELYKKLSS